MRKVESRQQPPAKLDEVLAAHYRADLMYEKEEKTDILSGDFRFRFSAENECLFHFRFVLGRKWNFIFVYGRK